MTSTEQVPATRLQELLHARNLAEGIGAVKDGINFFEDANGGPIHHKDVVAGKVASVDISGVCIAGALILSDVVLNGTSETGVVARVGMWYDMALPTAEAVYGQPMGCLTRAITQGGTAYVCRVLDRMIEDEWERTSGDAPSTTEVPEGGRDVMENQEAVATHGL
jgi:hypothetical protein